MGEWRHALHSPNPPLLKGEGVSRYYFGMGEWRHDNAVRSSQEDFWRCRPPPAIAARAVLQAARRDVPAGVAREAGTPEAAGRQDDTVRRVRRRERIRPVHVLHGEALSACEDL